MTMILFLGQGFHLDFWSVCLGEKNNNSHNRDVSLTEHFNILGNMLIWGGFY